PSRATPRYCGDDPSRTHWYPNNVQDRAIALPSVRRNGATTAASQPIARTRALVHRSQMTQFPQPWVAIRSGLEINDGREYNGQRTAMGRVLPFPGVPLRSRRSGG